MKVKSIKSISEYAAKKQIPPPQNVTLRGPSLAPLKCLLSHPPELGVGWQ